MFYWWCCGEGWEGGTSMVSLCDEVTLVIVCGWYSAVSGITSCCETWCTSCTRG